MPIEVRHDVGGAALAAAGLAGAAQRSERDLRAQQQRASQLQQLAQQRDMQQQQIAAQSQMQMQAADIAMERAAFQAGLQREMQEGAFNRNLQERQQEAEARAKEWSTKYTEQQKHDIARTQNGIEQARRSGLFSEEEMAQVERIGAMEMMGVSPTLTPKDDNQKQMDMLAEQGRSPGTPWKGEDGGWYSTEFDDTGKPKVRLLVRPDQTTEAIQAKLQMEREGQLAKDRLKLQDETIKDPRTPDIEHPRYRPVQIEAMLEQAYPWYREQNIQSEAQERQAAMQHRAIQQEHIQQQQVQQQAQQQTNDSILVAARESGVKLTEADMDLPAPVAIAQSQMREWINRYGGYDGLPDELKSAWLEAKRILEQYAAQMNQAVRRGQPVAQDSAGTTEPAPTRGEELLRGRGQFGGWN